MIKYAQIANEETGLCYVGTGTDEAYYQSIGMLPLDVEQSEVDNAWYLADKCPHYTDEEKHNLKKQARNTEIEEKIKELQIMSIPEILNSNTENIKIYNEVIAGLENSRP